MSNSTIPFDCYRVARITNKRSKLSFDIWVDDTGVSWKDEPPSALIWFSKKKNATGKQRIITMSVSDNPKVASSDICEIGLSELEMDEMVLFVRANSEGLMRLANPQDKYDIGDFLKEMVNGDDFNKVNMEIVETEKGKIQLVSPNEYGQLVLPQDWYEPEDDVYDDLYHDNVITDYKRKD